MSDNDQTFTSPVKDWARSNWGKLFCAKCHFVLHHIYPGSIDIYLENYPKILWYDVVFGACVGVIHTSLFHALGIDSESFACGRCFDREGKEIKNLKTMYNINRFVDRGQADNSDYYKCMTCGLILGSTGSPYIIRNDIPAGHVYQDTACSLYLSEELADRINWNEFLFLSPQVIPVRDEPLPHDLLPGVERVTKELLSRFKDGEDVYKAIEKEACRLGTPLGYQTVEMTIRGVNLKAKGNMSNRGFKCYNIYDIS